ncbi:MAG: hypothetical protein EBX40_00640 [Gammaproteobacteria bacterium]|nr:hypothetical protein [Gammaproteobacteria bacterium]
MAELCRRDFFFFIQEFWEYVSPEKPIYNWHVQKLAEEAQDVIFRLRDRKPKQYDGIVNQPPGTTKSIIWSIMLQAWGWAVDPTLRFLCISYSDALALQHAVKCRDVIRSDKYRRYFPEIEIKEDSDNKSDFKNTKQGQRMSAGLTGSITGIHAHLIVIDDPLNPKQAASDADCANARNLIDSTLTSRKVDKEVTATWLIMQRLSENDPTAHLLSKRERGKNVKHICLPAEVKDGVKPKELAQYYVDGLLDPVRLSRSVLADMKIDMGARVYAGQMSQRPAPATGLIWQRWFKVVPDAEFPAPKLMQHYGTDWDLAYTENKENAASAYITAGKVGKNIYIDDFGYEWLEFPQLIKWMKSKPGPHYIEAKASGKSAKQVLVNEGVIAIEVEIKGGSDKTARANMATPIAEAGFVHIRQSIAEALYTDGKQGILLFPYNKFKDVADTLAQCLQRLGPRRGIIVATG